MKHWFENYRDVYSAWWERTADTLEDDERESFTAYREPDTLQPMSPTDLKAVRKMFPQLQTEVVEFLERFGVGTFRFPDHDGDREPTEMEVFGPVEMEKRVQSILSQAEWELEILDEEIEGAADFERCESILKRVIENPYRFFPWFGHDNVYDFIYVLQDRTEYCVVSHWYHDYPTCELLDGTADILGMDLYGEHLVSIATSGDEYIL